MGGGDVPVGTQEASPQQGRPSSPVPSKMSEDRHGTHEEQLQALQDRLDEEVARRTAAEAEVIRLHRSLATEMELRQALEEQLRARPRSPSEASPPGLPRRRTATRQGLFSNPSPLFGSPPERRLGERVENGASPPSFPLNGQGGLGLNQGAGLEGETTSRGPPLMQPEVVVPTPPQEVPARRQGTGISRSLNGAFERVGETGGASGVLSPGLLEKLSQESEEREEALVRGSGNRTANASNVKLEEFGGASNFFQSGVNGGLRNGLGGDSRFGLDGGLRAGLGGNVRWGLDEGLRSGLDGGLRNGLDGGLRNGLAGAPRNGFETGLRNELDDEDSIATQVHEDEGAPEVFGGGGGAAAAAPLPGSDQTGFGSVFSVEGQAGPESGGRRVQPQGGGWGQVGGQAAPPPVQGGTGRGNFGGGQAGGRPATCYKCGASRILELTAKKGTNPGKQFYKCEACGKFLHWKEPLAAPGTPPRATGHISPRPNAGYAGPSASRGQKRPWDQGGSRGACQCGGEGEERICRNDKHPGRKYLVCKKCNNWLRWTD
ncbi:hypothetical protein KFL_001690060 [Klebsormidium nitens]|uniref:GRF-type domain-containing protein n=1 Tax=Klebsormidium nitens TaxID=105231 RepID=A0A1Y1I743_KLENI|nr:hypothetical protein KFL_001690060 [Klebsormidium nitens]|eukprot:GAQ83928.1 hypothetical protein KFL_001690060 [Klebsormidium nitens]